MRNEYFMKEYCHFDGDHNITINFIEVNTVNYTVTVAINNLGKLTQETVELREQNGKLFFEYGVMNEKIFIDDFESVEGDAA